MDDFSFYELLVDAVTRARRRWKNEANEDGLALLDAIEAAAFDRRHDLITRAGLTMTDEDFYALIRLALDIGWTEVHAWERKQKAVGKACVRGVLNRLGWEMDCREREFLFASLKTRALCA